MLLILSQVVTRATVNVGDHVNCPRWSCPCPPGPASCCSPVMRGCRWSCPCSGIQEVERRRSVLVSRLRRSVPSTSREFVFQSARLTRQKTRSLLDRMVSRTVLTLKFIDLVAVSATAFNFFSARQYICSRARYMLSPVCPSVCSSHGWISQNG